MSLQITSMADVFTILLVFLLKSYATGAVSVTPSKGMLLPEAQAADLSSESLKVEIGEGFVQIDGHTAAGLQAFRFEPKDIQANGSSSALTQVFEHERKKQLLIARANTDVKVDPKVLIIADQRVPYITLKSVLASAALHGYTDFKLAVAKRE